MLDHGLTYLCRFGNAPVPAAYNASTAEVVCPASPVRPAGEQAFAISLDGRHWAEAPMPFTFYVGDVTAIRPTGGPTGGGTSVLVEGVGLGTGSDYRCRYRAPNSATYITIRAGPHPPNPTVGRMHIPNPFATSFPISLILPSYPCLAHLCCPQSIHIIGLRLCTA